MLQTLFKALKRKPRRGRVHSERGDSLLYALESPTYPQAKLNKENRFSGWVFYYGDKTVRMLAVFRDEIHVGDFPVDGVREDIAQRARSIPAARTSGFSFALHLDGDADVYRFNSLFDDGGREELFRYSVREIVANKQQFDRMEARLHELPVPPPELIFLTLGHGKLDTYRNSIIPGFYNMQRYLKAAGANFSAIRQVLDFGCGSGRLLLGWHLCDPQYRLWGRDINEQLISWAKQNLPKAIDFSVSGLRPPLDLPDQSFDLIYLISVFTHLSLENQRQWLEEFTRLLRPGGYILISLHGEIYARNGYSEQSNAYRQFCQTGYMESTEQIEGSNQYCTFHSRKFFYDMLGSDFRLLGYFRNGDINGKRTLFRIALVQDVYVFQYLGGY